MTIKELLMCCDPDLDVHAMGRKTTASELLADIGDLQDDEVVYITTDHEVLEIGVCENEY